MRRSLEAKEEERKRKRRDTPPPPRRGRKDPGERQRCPSQGSTVLEEHRRPCAPNVDNSVPTRHGTASTSPVSPHHSTKPRVLEPNG